MLSQKSFETSNKGQTTTLTFNSTRHKYKKKKVKNFVVEGVNFIHKTTANLAWCNDCAWKGFRKNLHQREKNSSKTIELLSWPEGDA